MSDETTGSTDDSNATQDTSSVDDSQAVADAIQGESSGDDTKAVADSVDASEQAQWYYNEDVPGSGEKPEWLMEKYKNVEEQAKGYKELSSMMGAFTGAPEEYQPAELSKELQEMGINIKTDDPVYEKALEYAKTMNMSQEGLNTMMNLYGEVIAAENAAIEQIKQDQIKALGQNAQIRLDNLGKWANRNLSPELYESFQGLATSADAVKTLERLVAMTRNAPIDSQESKGTPGISKEEIDALLFAKDENQQRKMRDPEYAKMVNQKLDEYYGTDNHVEIIGTR